GAAQSCLVVPLGVAEPPLQVRLLAANDAVANCDCQRQHENQSPCASGAHTDAPVEQKHSEIDGIAAPAVDAGPHQGAGRFLGGYWRRRSREVANTRGSERKTDEDEGTGDRPLDQVTARDGERQRQQAIRGKAEQESSEKEKRRSRYDTRGLLVHLLPCPIHARACSGRCSQTTTKVSFCHLTMKVSTRKVVWLTEWNGDGVGTRQESGTPNRRQQGRGDHRADARSSPMLLQNTRRRSENRVDHQLGRRRVWLPAEPRAAWSADRAADRADAADQPPAHAAAGGRACDRGARGIHRQSKAPALEAGAAY